MPPGSAPARTATMTDRHMRPGERLRARARARQAQDGCNSGERGELEYTLRWGVTGSAWQHA
jgi:hypothetical protein